MTDVKYYTTSEIAQRLNMAKVDLQTFGRYIGITKIFGMYAWFDRDVERLLEILQFMKGGAK